MLDKSKNGIDVAGKGWGELEIFLGLLTNPRSVKCSVKPGTVVHER